MAKVYVSSTFLDLEKHREKVRAVLRRMGHEDVAMEYYVAEDKRPVERCLSDVAGCDLYVGIFAWRYGWVPKEDNPEGFSITEMEYRQAQKTGKPCLIFLLSEDAAWPPKFIDRDRTNIERLRNELGARHSSGTPFESPDDLGRLLAEAIHHWEKESGHRSARSLNPELDLEAYFAALTKRYQRLDLDALTPPQKEEYLQLQLRSVFVEQNVRENPPPVELPKEVWEKLQRDREIHPEDLPAGVTPEDVLRAREAYYEKPLRPVLDALTDARHQHAIILGDPGSGKSTLARYVMLSLIGDAGDEKLRGEFEGYLPLLIELRSYAGLCEDIKGTSFLDFVEFMGKNEGWGLDKRALERYLETDGRAVVIFDGLDEIFDPEDREQIARRIVGFTIKYPKARVVVTSRVIGYRRKILTDAGFAHFTLQDLDEQQVATFVERWYALALGDRPEEARERRERILRSFKESASIRQLAGNPMLLTIMAIIGKNQELPRERWKLYEHAAGVLIQHWDVSKHLKALSVDAPFIGEEDKKELLRRLAYKMQAGEGGLAGNYIHREQLQGEFENYVRERYEEKPARAKLIAEAMIGQFRERNFILSLYGANLYGFVHRAFLEYFCAAAFVHKFEKAQELSLEDLKRDVYGAHWEDRSWHEVLRLICGMIDEKFAGEIIKYLTEEVYQDEDKYVERLPWNISLAIQCLGELRNPGTVADAAGLLLRRTCPLFERPNGSDLATIGPRSYEDWYDFLNEHILEPSLSIGVNWPQRTILADWLRTLSPDAVYWLRETGRFVGIIGKDIEGIHQTLLGHARSGTGQRGLVALTALVTGWHSDAETLPLVSDTAVNNSSAGLRHYAQGILAEFYLEDEQNLQLLCALAINEEEEGARISILMALAEGARHDPRVLSLVRDRAMNDASPSPTTEEHVVQYGVRSEALDILAKHWPEHPETLPLLRERAEKDEVPYVREWAKEFADRLEAKAGK